MSGQPPILSRFDGPPLVPAGAAWVSDEELSTGGFWTWVIKFSPQAKTGIALEDDCDSPPGGAVVVSTVNSSTRSNAFTAALYHRGEVAPGDELFRFDEETGLSLAAARRLLNNQPWQKHELTVDVRRFVDHEGGNHAAPADVAQARLARRRRDSTPPPQHGAYAGGAVGEAGGIYDDAAGPSKRRKRPTKMLAPPPKPTTAEDPLCIISDSDDESTRKRGAEAISSLNNSSSSSSSSSSGASAPELGSIPEVTEQSPPKRRGGAVSPVVKSWPEMSCVMTAFGPGILLRSRRTGRAGATVHVVRLAFGAEAFLQPSQVSALASHPSEAAAMAEVVVSYPAPKAKGAVDLSACDLLRLSPGVYLNDNVVRGAWTVVCW
jgi:hypothetical protein